MINNKQLPFWIFTLGTFTILICPILFQESMFMDGIQYACVSKNMANGIGSSLADEQFLYGKGAGRYPTSSAVLSDISAVKYGYRYEYKKGLSPNSSTSRESVRCYISFDRNVAFDRSVFDSIKEEHICEEIQYIIGYIRPDLFKDTQIFEDNRISLICFN